MRRGDWQRRRPRVGKRPASHLLASSLASPHLTVGLAATARDARCTRFRRIARLRLLVSAPPLFVCARVV